MNDKILVTGHRGFIGRYVFADWRRTHGYLVKGIDHPDDIVDFEPDDYTDVDDGWFSVDGVDVRDMIKFEVQDVATGKVARIRSYLSDMTDTISPVWQVQNYVGRPDGVHHYESTTRKRR